MTTQNNIISKSAQKVQNALLQKGVEFKVIELPASAHTAIAAAEALECEVAQIVKSLIFKTKETHQPILVLASGINRVNEKAVAQIVGEKLEKADANFTREVTGYAIGGIPPVGHATQINTYIDEDLLKLGTLWAAAGTPNAVFSFESKDIESLTNGHVVCIK